MPDALSPAAMDRLNAHLRSLDGQLAAHEDGCYEVVDVFDKRVLLEVEDLIEFAKANGIM